MNVSVVSGFSLGDTPKNGMSVIVTTRGDAALAEALARDIASEVLGRPRSLRAATSRASPTRPGWRSSAGAIAAKPALLFADVADNPGGGGRGNTVWILEAFHKAGVEGALLGIFFDPALAAEAHALGKGANVPRAIQSRRDASALGPVRGRGARRGPARRQRRRPARHRRGAHDRAREDGAAARGRHPRRRGERAPAVQGHRDVRGVRPRHRRSPLGDREVARALPRRLRPALPRRAHRRGGRPRPHHAGALARALPRRAAARSSPSTPASPGRREPRTGAFSRRPPACRGRPSSSGPRGTRGG